MRGGFDSRIEQAVKLPFAHPFYIELIGKAGTLL